MKQRCTPQKSNRKMPKNGPYLKRVHLLKKKPSFWGLMVFVFGDVNGLEIVFFVESYIRVMINTQKHWRIDTTNVYFSILKIQRLDCCLIFSALKRYKIYYISATYLYSRKHVKR